VASRAPQCGKKYTLFANQSNWGQQRDCYFFQLCEHPYTYWDLWISDLKPSATARKSDLPSTHLNFSLSQVPIINKVSEKDKKENSERERERERGGKSERVRRCLKWIIYITCGTLNPEGMIQDGFLIQIYKEHSMLTCCSTNNNILKGNCLFVSCIS